MFNIFPLAISWPVSALYEKKDLFLSIPAPLSIKEARSIVEYQQIQLSSTLGVGTKIPTHLMDCKADKLSNSGHLGNQIVDQPSVPNEIYTARRT